MTEQQLRERLTIMVSQYAPKSKKVLRKHLSDAGKKTRGIYLIYKSY